MRRNSVLLVAIALIATQPVLAGPYTDDLTRCLIGSTSARDRESLVRWMFAALSQHPAVSSFTSVSAADIEDATKTVGGLFMRLITDACPQETKDAVRYEGASALEQAFNMLGQVAAGDLISHPAVTDKVAGIERHLDIPRLDALIAQ